MIKAFRQDLSFRKGFEKFEFHKLFFKFILRRALLLSNNEISNVLWPQLTLLTSRNYIHNFCRATGRSRGVYRLTRVSRLAFKNRNSTNPTPGFRHF